MKKIIMILLAVMLMVNLGFGQDGKWITSGDEDNYAYKIGYTRAFADTVTQKSTRTYTIIFPISTSQMLCNQFIFRFMLDTASTATTSTSTDSMTFSIYNMAGKDTIGVDSSKIVWDSEPTPIYFRDDDFSTNHAYSYLVNWTPEKWYSITIGTPLNPYTEMTHLKIVMEKQGVTGDTLMFSWGVYENSWRKP